jgi:hypothetical protein
MEDDDPLKPFRRPGSTRAERRAEPPPLPGSLKPYRAFDAQDKLVCLEIRRVLGTTHAPTYAYLLNITFDHEYYTGFVLHFSFMQVKVRGKNLKDVITALKLRKCEYIQDFHPSEFAPPKPGEPIIESIKVEWRGDPIEAGGEGEKEREASEKP